LWKAKSLERGVYRKVKKGTFKPVGSREKRQRKEEQWGLWGRMGKTGKHKKE